MGGAPTPHLARLILLGLYTGSRLNVMLQLRWDWIDFASGVMLRRQPGTAESKQKKTPPVRLGRESLHIYGAGAGSTVRVPVCRSL